MDQAQQIENIKKGAFGEQFDKDIAEFRHFPRPRGLPPRSNPPGTVYHNTH